MDLASVWRELRLCVETKTVEHAKMLVRCLSNDQLQEVARHKSDDGLTLLFTAVMRNRPSFVKFLLDDCHADVDQRCNVGYELYITPLCWAVYFFDVRVVRLLVEHGSDVNDATDNGWAPVLAACENNPSLVDYLVQHGADTNTPGVYGITCLMLLLAHQPRRHKLIKYVIERGASVNAVNNMGVTALHCAVESRSNIRLLLRHGADASKVNYSGDNVLQTAAQHGCTEVLDYLISKLQPTHQRCADLYSLVAAQYIDSQDDYAGAMEYWRKSMSFGAQALQDAPISDGNPVYNGAVEARDLQSLDAIANDEDALYMQALICRQRILGSSHRETIHWLSMRALHYARSNFYQRGVNLYKYASACSDASSLHELRSIGHHADFCQLFWDRYAEDSSNVAFDDVADAMRMMTKMSRYPSNISWFGASETEKAISLAVEALHLLCHLLSSEVQSVTREQLVGELVRSTRRVRGRRNPLHCAVDTIRLDAKLSTVVEGLLDAGVDVNAVDSAGNTPLQVAVRNAPSTSPERDVWLLIVDLLLRRGAHVDIPNAQGATAADRLPASVDVMQYTTLQCLAARAVLKYHITYHGVVPTTLADFTDKH